MSGRQYERDGQTVSCSSCFRQHDNGAGVSFESGEVIEGSWEVEIIKDSIPLTLQRQQKRASRGHPHPLGHLLRHRLWQTSSSSALQPPYRFHYCCSLPPFAAHLKEKARRRHRPLASAPATLPVCRREVTLRLARPWVGVGAV